MNRGQGRIEGELKNKIIKVGGWGFENYLCVPRPCVLVSGHVQRMRRGKKMQV